MQTEGAFLSPDKDDELDFNDFMKQGGVNIDEIDSQYDEEEEDKELE